MGAYFFPFLDSWASHFCFVGDIPKPILGKNTSLWLRSPKKPSFGYWLKYCCQFPIWWGDRSFCFCYFCPKKRKLFFQGDRLLEIIGFNNAYLFFKVFSCDFVGLTVAEGKGGNSKAIFYLFIINNGHKIQEGWQTPKTAPLSQNIAWINLTIARAPSWFVPVENTRFFAALFWTL